MLNTALQPQRILARGQLRTKHGGNSSSAIAGRRVLVSIHGKHARTISLVPGGKPVVSWPPADDDETRPT